MSIIFGQATPDDYPALVEIWNAAFGPKWPMTERLLRQTLEGDPYYEPEGCLIARSQGQSSEQIVGWVLAKTMRTAGPELGRFSGRGGIGALCVHPTFQRQGIGSALLQRTEAFLRAADVVPNFLYFPHHFMPGVPAEFNAALRLLEKRGYRREGEHFDLWRDLQDYELPPGVLQAMQANPTVELRPAHEEEQEAVIAFVEREFPGAWHYSTRNHFERGAAASDFIIAVEGGKVIGFCHTADRHTRHLLASTYWHNLMGENYGGLGPIGIAKDERKRGLGLALCAVAVEDLKKRGVTCMGIDWTGLVAFYEKLGFRVWKNYIHMTQ
jgi:ribosomal protein S18 acetylase RimI-like enzyme